MSSSRGTTSSSPAKTRKRLVSEVEEEETEEADAQQHKKVRWGSQLDDDEDETSEEASTRPEKLCLSAACSSGKLGCSYYDPVKSILYVLEDTQEDAHFDLMQLLLEQAIPDVVLVGAQADDELIEICRAYTDSTESTFQLRPQKDFKAIRGRSALMSLGFLNDLSGEEQERTSGSDHSTERTEPRNAYEFMQRRTGEHGDPTLKRWNASIRMSNYASLDSAPLMLGSIGALLDYISRQRAVGDLEDEGIGGLQVRGIETLTLDRFMHINRDALYSLQVFEAESHASIHSDKTKEGLSLFGILNQTKTTLGYAMLKTWLLRPSLPIPIITARHDAVACFTRAENFDVAFIMHNHLKGMKPVPKVLASIRAGRATATEWQGLMKFSYDATMLRDKLSELSGGAEVEIVRKLVEALDTASFREVSAMLNETIDWEESSVAGRVCVRPHIDEELDNRKHIYNGIDAVLSKVAEEISDTVPSDYAATLNVVYFPQLGYLICVPMLDEWKTESGIKVLEGWTFQFSSESHVYFKDDKMHDLDKHLGDLYPSIVDRELEIIQELQEGVLQYDGLMSKACDICAELDCLICFAKASKAYDYRQPEMSEDNVLIIKQGRHPLQEQVVDTFVPNSITLVGGAGNGIYPVLRERSDESEEVEDNTNVHSVMVCTGANGCGKSIYLKQTALIQIMAQIGCFVPAESAIMGVVDKIFTRVQTRESVSKVQSAFMIDLNQVSLALRNSTARSLILLDEFGKGTIPTDGAGLFAGVIQSLLSRGEDCPKVLATTHFHEVFRRDLLDPRRTNVAFAHMEVMFTNAAGEVVGGDVEEGSEVSGSATERGETITYLYRVAPGLSLHSHAGKCAELCGIRREVVQRATYVSQLLAAREIPRLLDESLTECEVQDMEDAEAICRRFLEWDLTVEQADSVEEVKQTLFEVLGRQIAALEEVAVEEEAVEDD
ncbi:hypothetical protein PENSPDRAFT_648571 [Peniophora sp. CONT]|nr:hypothetical protein PENSPDRAFT_648571 [Peniophora sp. CONT]